MELEQYVTDLQRQLVSSAEHGGDDTRAVAERLASGLDAATRLVLLDALSAAVGEITRDLAPGSVDVIFMCDTYHHIGRRVTYLKNVSGALKAGGRIVIVDFIGGPLPIGPPPEHKLAEGTVRTEFGGAGYRLIQEHKILPYQYFLEFAPI